MAAATVPAMSGVAVPGCYGVVRTGGFYAWLIRHACRSDFDHAFVVCEDGQIVEAEPAGARWGQVSDYDGYEVLYNTAEPMTDAQRTAVMDEAVALLDTPYGWTDVIRLGLRTLGVQWKWLTVRADNERAMVCSQIVARAGEAAGLDWNCGREAPAAVTPADLADRIKRQAWTRSQAEG